jgi:hypothetical protein
MWIMNDQGYAQLRIEVRPSPETNDHEVRLMADGESLVDRFSTGLIGLDPADLLTDSCGLRAENESHRVTVGRCSCGIVGCGSVEVDIRRDHEQVIWTATDSSQQVRFPAAQYGAEVERALRDHTWETPERTASRLISQAVDRTVLARRGFEFSWASGRCRDGMMTASLVLTPGPYQVLVSVPWDGENIDGIVAHFEAILSQSPETWLNVECNAQVRGLDPPPIAGPGWNRGK